MRKKRAARARVEKVGKVEKSKMAGWRARVARPRQTPWTFLRKKKSKRVAGVGARLGLFLAGSTFSTCGRGREKKSSGCVCEM